jgi:Protein of unknown function (DUF3631)
MLQNNVLDEVYDFLGRFVVYPNDHCRTIHALWIVHTHLIEAFYSTPRRHVTSATSGCGKTTLLNLTNLLVSNPMPILNPSPASLYYLIDREHPTLLIDEIDTLFAKKDTFDITSIVNSGFDKSSQGVPRVNTESGKVEFFNVFGPMLLAGIDKDNMPDTIENRCIQIRLRKKLPSEEVASYRPRMHKPYGDELRTRLESWIKEKGISELATEMCNPKMPDSIENRNADKWEALFIVADVADAADVTGISGWGKKAREAALFLLSQEQESEPKDNGELLLNDVRTVLETFDEISTSDLLDALYRIPEANWFSYSYGKSLTARQLAGLLKPYNIRPTQIRFKGKETPERGYYKASFVDAWNRHLPGCAENGVANATSVSAVTDYFNAREYASRFDEFKSVLYP